MRVHAQGAQYLTENLAAAKEHGEASKVLMSSTTAYRVPTSRQQPFHHVSLFEASDNRRRRWKQAYLPKSSGYTTAKKKQSKMPVNGYHDGVCQKGGGGGDGRCNLLSGLTGRIAYLKTGHKLEICIYT